MRKVFAFAAVAGLLTFAACGEKKAENTEATTETTVATDSAAATMEPAMDSAATAAPAADSAAAHTDSTHKM